MNKKSGEIYEGLFSGYPMLEGCRENVLRAFEMLKHCFANGGKLMACGNGGSASDAEHIIGELMKGFLSKRIIPETDAKKLKKLYPENGVYLASKLQRALPAISLVSQSSLISAYVNDVAADMVFAQQVYGYGEEGDVLIGLSTSGNSANVVNALRVAKAFDIRTIAFTGMDGGESAKLCDVPLQVPESETYKVQELHVPLYHTICAMVEAELFQ
jgi:phosphoheptose isomerase